MISIWAQTFAKWCCDLSGGPNWAMASPFEKAEQEMVDLLSKRGSISEMCSCVSGPCLAVLEMVSEISRVSYGVFVKVVFPVVANGADFVILKTPQWTGDVGCEKVKECLLLMPLCVWNQCFKEKLPMTTYFVGLMHVVWKSPSFLHMFQPLEYLVFYVAQMDVFYVAQTYMVDSGFSLYRYPLPQKWLQF